MKTSDICDNLVEGSVIIECSESIHSTALDDFAGVHVATKTTSNASAPALPFRTRTETRNTVQKARAPSPMADIADDGFTSPPPVPPRLPPRKNHSSKYNQRCSGKSGLSQGLVLSTPVSHHPSGIELLRSRPPPPPPPRDAVFTDVSAALTIQSNAHTSCKSSHLTSSRLHESDVMSFPSREQRSSHLRQLSDWPISFRSSIMNTQQQSTGSRKMNDYIDSPIALHSSSVNCLEMMENSINSEISESSCDHHLWPLPLATNSVSSTKKKSDNEQKKEIAVHCQQRIICEHCGKCRCNHCTNTRPLPRCWAGECECSAQSVVDCCTCMCCARALFYHCRTTEDYDYSDNPCACTEQRDCCKRWTLLTLLSFCLPCLCLYYPLDCTLRLCTVCYNRRHSTGCCCCEDAKCRTEASKGLLIESESSSF